jgi:hypothetical protein
MGRKIERKIRLTRFYTHYPIIVKDKDRLIIIFYVDVSSIQKEDTSEYLAYISNALGSYFDNSVKTIFVPTLTDGNRVECINPVQVNRTQYVAVLEKITRLKEAFEKALNEYTVKNNNNGRK